MTSLVTTAATIAASARTDPASGLLPWAFLLGLGYVVVSLFSRRIGGKGGGSDKSSVGAWMLLAAIFVGVLVASK
jgi:hypothetical protein